jgi:hypothetical protein
MRGAVVRMQVDCNDEYGYEDEEDEEDDEDDHEEYGSSDEVRWTRLMVHQGST